jgi:hypothetical protein
MTQQTAKQMDSEALTAMEDFGRLEGAFGNPRVESSIPATLTQPKLPELNRIAQLILEIDSNAIGKSDSDEGQIRSHNRGLLAAQLGCTPDDLQAVVDSYGDQWQEYILEARIRAGHDSTHMRDVTWDRLEAATLKKLVLIVETSGNRLTIAELLAVAKTANTANRGDRAIKGPGQGVGGGPAQVQTNIFLGGDPANGVLPAGNLGMISLNLSQRVLKQLSTPKEIEGESERVLDNMEMMGIKDIQKIGEGMDKATDEKEGK